MIRKIRKSTVINDEIVIFITLTYEKLKLK
jgi:hypothetical protein